MSRGLGTDHPRNVDTAVSVSIGVNGAKGAYEVRQRTEHTCCRKLGE